MTEIQAALDSLGQMETLTFKNVPMVAIARVLLLVLKKLPTPLLSLELHDRWRAVSQLEPFEENTMRIRYIAYFLGMLPQPNYETFRKVLRTLAKSWYANHWENRQELLHVWAAPLFLRESVHDVAMDLPWATHLLQIMIENHTSIYPKKKAGINKPSIGAPPLDRPLPPNPSDAGRVIALPPLHVAKRESNDDKSTPAQLEKGKSSVSELRPASSPSVARLPGGGLDRRAAEKVVIRERSWLSAINAAKVVRLDVYHSKMEELLNEVRKWSLTPRVASIVGDTSDDPPNLKFDKAGEFLPCLEVCTEKLGCMVKSLNANNPEALPKIIDTYHIDRCHMFVVDLHSIVKHEIDRNTLDRYFITTKLHGTIQRLYMSMEQELSLAFSTVDTLLSGAMTSDPTYQQRFKSHTTALFSEHARSGAEWWSTNFGPQSFTAPWSLFVNRLLDVSTNIPDAIKATIEAENNAVQLTPTQRKSILRKVLDPGFTGCVSVYKFAKFLDGFGSLEVAARHCEHVTQQPWFHGYVSDEEAGRFLEVFGPGSFVVHFPQMDPNKFKIWYKAGGNQFKKIHIDTRHFAGNSGTSQKNWTTLYFVANESFPSLDALIEKHKEDLDTPKLPKMHSEPWFYGEFTAIECQAYLQYELPGTFLVRYSSSDPECFTLSHVSKGGNVMHYRLRREWDGTISVLRDANTSLAFDTIDSFVSATKELTHPYKHDNHVSTTQEEETARNANSINFAALLRDDEPLLASTLLQQLVPVSSLSQIKSAADASAILGKKHNHSVTSSASPNIHDEIPQYRAMDASVTISDASPIHARPNYGSILSVVSQILKVRSLPLPSQNASSEEKASASVYSGYLGPDMRSAMPGAEAQLGHLLTKIAQRAPITYRELANLYSSAFSVSQATYANAQKKARRDATKGSGKKGKTTAEPCSISIPNAPLHELRQCKFDIKNKKTKSDLQFKIDAPAAITHRAFIAVSPSSGILKAGESISITVSVVLFKPCTIQDIIFLHIDPVGGSEIQAKGGLGIIGAATLGSSSSIPSQTLCIPFSVSVDKNHIWFEQFSYWSVPENFMVGIESKSPLGRGQAAAVYSWNLLGVDCAVKRWDIGRKDPNPEDMKHELSLMSGLQHTNVIRLVGACQGMIVMELMSGSLDSVLKVRRPTDEEVLRIEAESLTASGFPLPSSSSSGDALSSRAPSSLHLPKLSGLGGSGGDANHHHESSPLTARLTHDSQASDAISSGGGYGSGSIQKNSPEFSATLESFPVRLPIALAIAKALLCLHDNSLLHRDVKSLNVLIHKDTMSARLADFGEVDHQDAGRNDSAGSLPWMAPEVFLGMYYAYKADVFSFGCFLYELLMGVNPQRSPAMVERGIMPIIPPEFANASLFCINDFVRLILYCTLRTPEKRPTMFAVVRELEKIISKSRIDVIRR